MLPSANSKRSEAMKAMWAKKRAAGTLKNKKKYRKKGKWSKMARAKHSVRMKERFAAKQLHIAQPITANKLTISERLNTIEHHVNAIRQQLGGTGNGEVSGM